MTQSCPTSEVVAAVRRVMAVNEKQVVGMASLPYDVVVAILREQHGHSTEEAHALFSMGLWPVTSPSPCPSWRESTETKQL